MYLAMVAIVIGGSTLGKVISCDIDYNITVFIHHANIRAKFLLAPVDFIYQLNVYVAS